jgi:uncharacterized protein
MPLSGSIRAARPTIAVDGADIRSLGEGLLAMLIIENVQGLYRCEATFGNWGNVGNDITYLYFDRKLLDFGRTFQVKIDQDVVFEGRIMALEAQYPRDGGPRLTVLSEDRFQEFRMTRRTRAFVNMSDGDVIRQLAREHGVQSSVDISGSTHSTIAQVNQSDLAFIRERARTVGAEVWMDGSTLYAKSRPNRGKKTIPLSYKQDLFEFVVIADLAHQRTSVTVGGWDVAAKTALKYEATSQAITSELNGYSSGASILSAALGERKEVVTHAVPLTSQETQSQAEAWFRTCARRFVAGRGTAQTDCSLRAGNYVDLKGLGPLFNGQYYLTEVRHLFDGQDGIRTEFDAERAWLGK